MFNQYKTPTPSPPPTKEQKFKAYIEEILKTSLNGMTYDTKMVGLTQDYIDFVNFLKVNQIQCQHTKGYWDSHPTIFCRWVDLQPSTDTTFCITDKIHFQYPSKNDLIDALNKLPLDSAERNASTLVSTPF